MAFLGKEFVFTKEENYDAFVKSFGLDEDHSKKVLGYKPNEKIEKDGDGYKLIFEGGGRVLSFKSGVAFEEDIGEIKSETTITVDGNTVTQDQVFGPLKVTHKREYSGDSLKVTATNTQFDGAAYRWYKSG